MHIKTVYVCSCGKQFDAPEGLKAVEACEASHCLTIPQRVADRMHEMLCATHGGRSAEYCPYMATTWVKAMADGGERSARRAWLARAEGLIAFCAEQGLCLNQVLDIMAAGQSGEALDKFFDLA